jgi:SAM-dependent methyltransferase
MVTIPFREITYHPQSFAGSSVRVFWWKGEIYRGLSGEAATLFKKLFQDGVLQRLMEKGLLIESELTPLVLDGFEMVVRHKTIPFVSYPDEWCAAMYKMAALMTIDLATELAQWNLTLEDAHPWNAVFDIDTCKPVYVDYGSITPRHGSTWSDHDQFCGFYLYPLILMAHGQDRIARLLVPADELGVLEPDLSKLTGVSPPPRERVRYSIPGRLTYILRRVAQRLPNAYRQQLKRSADSVGTWFPIDARSLKSKFESLSQRSHLRSLEKLRRQVESVALPPLIHKRSDTCVQSSLSISPQSDWTAKQKNVHKVLTQLQPSSVLDIGSGDGWYSKLAALLGSRVVAFDIDQACVAQLYSDACENKLPVLPLVMDFTRPTPARGLSNRAGIAAVDRFRCDLVLALGLVHQIALGFVNPIVGKQFVNFEQIAEGLALFSKQWVLVEFVPIEAQGLEGRHQFYYPWYNLDGFISALRGSFRNVSIMPSQPEPCVLLLCQK